MMRERPVPASLSAKDLNLRLRRVLTARACKRAFCRVTLIAFFSAGAMPVAAGSAPTNISDPLPDTISNACAGRDGWAEPAPPVKVYGNTYYVGTCGITALLVRTRAGLVLLDGGVPEAAPLIIANIRKLGFNPRRIRWILVSHEHFDHAGALAEIQRQTGARVIAGPNQASLLESGRPDPADPQASTMAAELMQPLSVFRTQPHASGFDVGGVRFTAWATPAHSPGSTSWTWQACEGSRCYTIAYADSASTISAGSYLFSDHPDRVAGIRQGLAVIADLPCDIIVTPHPAASNLLPRLSGAEPLTDSDACKRYAANAITRFNARLEKEVAVGSTQAR